MHQQEKMENQSDLQAINNVREAHIASLNNGDASGWAAAFTNDGVQMPPNAPANMGRESILQWSSTFLTLFNVKFELMVEEVQVGGDWVFERGTYKINLLPKGGGDSMDDIGKYITIYERQSGGDWGIARDIWNSNKPPLG